MPTVIRSSLLLLAAGLAAGPAPAADPPAKPNTLTPKEIADGWVLLFDGETTFGWADPGGEKAEVTARDGRLTFRGGEKGRSIPVRPWLTDYELAAECEADQLFYLFSRRGHYADMLPVEKGGQAFRLTYPPPAAGRFEVKVNNSYVPAHGGQGCGQLGGPALELHVPAGAVVKLWNVKLRPLGLAPLFTGKDLAGWTPYTGDPKRERSRFTVTPAGELRINDGPGDLQTDKQFADFVLQLECKTNGPNLNGGVFFRGLPGQYQQGYEAQISNAVKDNDRTKPADFGTGAIYRRVPARKVVSTDNEWFGMTVLASGPHLATWVNGYPTVSWADDRKPADNARQGLKTGPGVISLQGHDPTTDLLFRNIRIAELKK